MADGFLTEIHYLVATPDWCPEDTTPLAGFSPRLALSSELIRRVALLPANVYELCPEYHLGRIATRVCGTSVIQFFPQSPRAIMSEPMPLETPFSVIILGPGQSVAPYQAWLASCPIKPIVVAEKDGMLAGWSRPLCRPGRAVQPDALKSARWLFMFAGALMCIAAQGRSG